MKRTAERGHSYPDALEAFDGFADSSYGNDVTDSVVLAVGSTPITIWIEHEDLAHRSQDYGWNPELPVSDRNTPPSRFVVCTLVAPSHGATISSTLNEREIADAAPIFESDDPDALLAFLKGMSGAL